MPFTPSFTVAQSPLDPSVVIVSDTSQGSDPAIVKRIITFKNSYGNYVVPQGTTTDYIDWPLSTNPITLNLLTQDEALCVTVSWLNSPTVDPANIIYDSIQDYCFAEFNKQFLYYLIQNQSLTFNIIQDTNYWGNVALLWTNIIGAINSVQIAGDIYASQVCLDRATFLATNQDKFF